MGKSKEPRLKNPKVKDATITEDGSILIEFNEKIYPHTKSAIFTPQALLALVSEYGEIPPVGTNDFDGIPMVDYEDVFDDDDSPERNGEADEEEGERK